MKIVFVSYLNYYNFPGGGHSYEYLHMAGAFQDMGHTVIFVDSQQPDPATRTMQAVRDTGADMVFYVPVENEMDMALFATIPIPKAIMLPDDHWRRDYGLRLAPHVDYVLATAPDSAQAYGAKYVPFQWGFRASLYDLPPRNRPFDMAWIGMGYGYREQYIRAIQQVGICRTFVAGQNFGRMIPSDEIPGYLVQARIGLSLSGASKDPSIKQVKTRPFEVVASGALLLTEDAPGTADCFTDGIDAVVFTSLPEMIDKLFYYLTHEDQRQRIANAGRERAFREHTYTRRYQGLLERIA